MGKKGKSTKHRKTREFLALPGGRRLGRRPLSPTERRELPYGNATARGPLAGLRGYAPCRRPLGESEFGTLRVPAVNIFHSDGGRCSVKVALRSLMAQACRSRRRQHGLQTFMEFERNQKISNSKDEHSKSTGQSKS